MNTKTTYLIAIGAAAVLGGLSLLRTPPAVAPQTDPPPVADTDVRQPAGRPDSGILIAPPDLGFPPRPAGEVETQDPSAHFARPYKVERVCRGKKGAVLPDGTSILLEDCHSVDRNPSIYESYDTEQLLADIEAGQPWAVEAMEVLGMRYFAQGYVQAGAGWLKEHAARTGKVGLLHVAQLSYLAGNQTHALLRYELIGILLAGGYPGYERKMLATERRWLLESGADATKLDAIDAAVSAFVAGLPKDDASRDDGGAS